MQIKNLSQSEASEIETRLRQMQAHNPTLNWFITPMGDPTGPVVDPTGPHHGVYNPTIGQLEELKESVAALDRKLDRIFGGHVLIGGAFIKL